MKNINVKKHHQTAISDQKFIKNKSNIIEINKIYNIDYLELLLGIEDESIDFICIDPPYGKIKGMRLSGQKAIIDWDNIIDWNLMFKIFNKKLKKGGTIAVFGQQPTYSQMISANLKNFKYEFIWEKNNSAQGFHSNKMPLIYTENIAIFIKTGDKRIFNKPNTPLEINKKQYFNRWYAQQLFYFIGKTRRSIHSELGHRKLEFYFHFVGKHFSLLSEKNYNDLIKHYHINSWEKFIPYSELKEKWIQEKHFNKNVSLDSCIYNGTFKNILKISKDYKPYYHPTQKPLKLMEILIKIFTNENDLVLDCFAGSGSTLVASKKLNRNFIGSEIEKKYYDIALKRIKNAVFL